MSMSEDQITRSQLLDQTSPFDGTNFGPLLETNEWSGDGCKGKDKLLHTIYASL